MKQSSISWFAVIGATAAAVHYVVAVGVEFAQILSPAQANILGFLLAFPVSYLGHRKLSFAGHTATHQQAFPKFFAVALGGFLINQFMVVNALSFTAMPFWLILAIVMILVAISTYLLSHYWAFKGEV
jgi:putative flippase GtrA